MAGSAARFHWSGNRKVPLVSLTWTITAFTELLFSSKFAHSRNAMSSSVIFLMIWGLFVVFLLPFDRRIIERYVQRFGAQPVAPVSLGGGTRSGKVIMDDGFSETTMRRGPYTRQLRNMLDLKVVVLGDLISSPVGSRFGDLAIGRWNEEAQEFDIVTEWCKTWEELEEEARQAMKSFRGVAHPKYRSSSTA